MTQREVLPMFSVPTTAKPHAVATEKRRLNAAALRVLAFLKERAYVGALNYEICAPEIGGNRGIGRVDELREHYQIDKEHIRAGVWRYTLKGYR